MPDNPKTRPDVDGIRARFRAISRLTLNVRPQMIAISFLAFINGILEAGFLVIIAKVALSLTEGNDSISLFNGYSFSEYQSLAFAFALIAFRYFLALLSVRISASLVYKVGVELRMRLSRAFLRSSWEKQQAQPAGTLQQLVVAFPTQGSDLIYSLSAALGGGITLIAMLAISFLVNFAATSIVLIALVLFSSLLRPLRRRLNSRSNASIAPQVDFSNGVAQISTLGLEINSFGVADEVEKEVANLILQEADSQKRVRIISNSISPSYVSLAYIAVILAVLLIALLGTDQLGSAGAVMVVMLRTLGYGQQLQSGSVSISLIRPFIEIIEKTINEFEQSSRVPGTQNVGRIEDIEFKNVTFSYHDNFPVLKGLSFKINHGEIIGIVGPSGSGKSTLVQLLLGLRVPRSGEVKTGGIEISLLHPSSWRTKISFVPQEATLVTGTVAENIAFYRNDITRQDMVDAARAAHVLEDIERLPLGFDTHLGERAQELSGGQRQRISIARALVSKPEVLILDEPTSALDMASESAIRQTIADLKGKVTVVVIAHRLSTLDICHRLMVIQDGELKAFDTPTNLSKDNDFYKEALRLAGVR